MDRGAGGTGLAAAAQMKISSPHPGVLGGSPPGPCLSSQKSSSSAAPLRGGTDSPVMGTAGLRAGLGAHLPVGTARGDVLREPASPGLSPPHRSAALLTVTSFPNRLPGKEACLSYGCFSKTIIHPHPQNVSRVKSSRVSLPAYSSGDLQSRVCLWGAAPGAPVPEPSWVSEPFRAPGQGGLSHTS